MKHWYNVGPEERYRCGELGRQFVLNKQTGMTADEMSARFITSMDNAFKNWTPRTRFEMEVV